MKYTNADSLLPEELLQEIQRYVHGGMIYIPKRKDTHSKWGEQSGTRVMLNLRNHEIREKFAEGATVDQLIDQYALSSDSIKKIVYSRKNKS